MPGTWYPGSSGILREDIEHYFFRVPDRTLEGEIYGLIVPHAGYAYSGQVAAHAYKLIRGKVFDAVIVIGPSHRTPFRGVSIYTGGGYETPLGVVSVDEDLAREILRAGEVITSLVPEAHAQEHSLEIQLPFLQVALGRFAFVPLVMGDQNRETCQDLAKAVVRAAGKRRVLIVGSSDLSHYHPYEKAVEMDHRAIERMEKMDALGLLDVLATGASEACGGGPAAVTMMAAGKLGADRGEVLKYANSGDVTGDRSGVVGYASIVFYRKSDAII